jgi:hypothetical protein
MAAIIESKSTPSPTPSPITSVIVITRVLLVNESQLDDLPDMKCNICFNALLHPVRACTSIMALHSQSPIV